LGSAKKKGESELCQLRIFRFGRIFAPMIYFFKTKISHSNRITALESDVSIIKQDMKKIDTLCDDVSYIKGLLDEHLRK